MISCRVVHFNKFIENIVRRRKTWYNSKLRYNVSVRCVGQLWWSVIVVRWIGEMVDLSDTLMKLVGKIRRSDVVISHVDDTMNSQKVL